MTSEIKFGGTLVTVDEEVVAKITGITRTTSIAEENIAGAEDVVDGGDIIRETYASISVGETATLEGISISGDVGQSAIKDAADKGREAVIEQIFPTGAGYRFTGFFSNVEERGTTTEVYKFNANFRVNSKEEIEAS